MATKFYIVAVSICDLECKRLRFSEFLADIVRFIN